MGRFQILLLDADNTLFDFQACEREALTLAFKKYGYPLDEEIRSTYERINTQLWKKYEQGLLNKDEVIYSRFALLFQEIGIDDDGIQFEDDYQELLGMQHFFIPDAYEVVESLSHNYDLYILTNGVTKTQLQRLKDSRLDRFMKRIFVSEETGYQKPMKEYFDYCFERIENFDRSKAMMIGDSLSSDIKGGNNASVTTCWFNPESVPNNSNVKVDYEVKSLKELCRLLESL